MALESLIIMISNNALIERDLRICVKHCIGKIGLKILTNTSLSNTPAGFSSLISNILLEIRFVTLTLTYNVKTFVVLAGRVQAIRTLRRNHAFKVQDRRHSYRPVVSVHSCNSAP
jgi:hypothetical protein